MNKLPAIACAVFILSACERQDTTPPVIIQNHDPYGIHERGAVYQDPGAAAMDNYTCDLTDQITVTNDVDIYHYGSYTINYTVSDAAGNTTESIRPVDIVLPLTDYYSENYQAYDTCTSGNYQYTGLIEDCNCSGMQVIVGNISNFGLGALFPLPISGQYNQVIELDTAKADLQFSGTGVMSPGADTIRWNYSIADTVSTDVCRSVWVKH